MPKRPSSLPKGRSQYTENLSEDIQTHEISGRTLIDCEDDYEDYTSAN